MPNTTFENLTDEEILNEFVKRFKCDGAILVYLDSGNESGFGRWRNSEGRNWVNHLFNQINQETKITHIKRLGKKARRPVNIN